MRNAMRSLSILRTGSKVWCLLLIGSSILLSGCGDAKNTNTRLNDHATHIIGINSHLGAHDGHFTANDNHLLAHDRHLAAQDTYLIYLHDMIIKQQAQIDELVDRISRIEESK